MYDSICIKSPEQRCPKRQNQAWWLPGMEAGEWGIIATGMGFLIKMKPE